MASSSIHYGNRLLARVVALNGSRSALAQIKQTHAPLEFFGIQLLPSDFFHSVFPSIYRSADVCGKDFVKGAIYY